VADRALYFDEGSHTFTRGGPLSPGVEIVPSVTQVIGACGLRNAWATGDSWARDRGVRVHAAMFALTTTSEDAALAELEPDDVPYFTAAQWWMVSCGVEVLGCEELVDGGSYAGWRDLRVRMRGNARTCVVDLKTGGLPWWTGLQLAAYALPLQEPHDRFAVRLSLDGQPHVKQYRDAHDRADFLACLRVVQLQNQQRSGR
jgi:hypothetical protein